MVWTFTVFAIYFFIFSYLLYRFIPDRSFTGFALVAFWVKILFGCLYGYYFARDPAALRFADDAEFKALLEKTLQENLAPEAIKQSIRHWQGDLCRYKNNIRVCR